MTFVVVKSPQATEYSDEVHGMIMAGEKLNDVLKEDVDYKCVFREMYDRLTAESYSVNVTDGDDHELKPDGGNQNHFKYDQGKKFHLKPHVDKEDQSSPGEPPKIMNFVVPKDRTDFLSNSPYITRVINGIESITKTNLTAAQKMELAKYLLANIFLTRCH